MKTIVWVIDDDKSILEAARIAIQHDFDQIITSHRPDTIPSMAQLNEVDVALLDMNFRPGQKTGNEGLYWLDRIRELNPDISIVLLTAFGEIDLAVEGLKRGATDFIVKPWSNDKLVATLKSAAQLAHSKREIRKLKTKEQALKANLRPESHEIIGESAAIRQVRKLIEKVAPTPANVLILGENGTGKELVARQIHAQSLRSNELFLAVDVGNIPTALFESELFGHVKGAYTDAHADRLGKFETASGGTLFLDEISNLPLDLQPKLLSALQNRQITPLGSNQLINIDIRLISASNQDPHNLVHQGFFREDLLYRLNTISIVVPPLRSRGTDILILAQHFGNYYAEKYKKAKPKLDQSAKNRLMNHPWPGNVRELQHSMEKAIILSDQALIGAELFSFRAGNQQEIPSLIGSLQEMEQVMIQKAMERNHGNVSAAAAQLGVSRQTLYNKLKSLKDQDY